MPEYTNMQLLRKIIEAELALKSVHIPHRNACPANDDTGYPAACTCGADKAMAPIYAALMALKVE